jgi:hypothetical protein
MMCSLKGHCDILNTCEKMGEVATLLKMFVFCGDSNFLLLGGCPGFSHLVTIDAPDQSWSRGEGAADCLV